ncbi:MAG: chromosome segregation protein SMC [Eubacterium sp.]|nr:chromosome segregation protein SMC [Eubacterium sp.]
MYLKSIEVNGFKSFANKITFSFNEGITAIVGPNGSGKSNIGDAVRWVLGEQSALKLRGSRMEDVIFAGTELRKPQGFAYVAITLDNSDHSLPVDFTEVTVARRVYRSGESEYLINGTVTRLKDVAALFFDTGIGKEGYSIIGQGQIERILSGKPDDRRDLFDEAAGIVKYKKNKLATEKALEAEHANLNRVNDILSGLEERVGPLEMQSEKAKRYLRLKEEQKRLDINVFNQEIDRIEEKIGKNRQELETTLADQERLQQEFDHTKEEYDRLEEELELLTEEMQKLTNDSHAASILIEHTEGEIRVLEERILSARSVEQELVTRMEKIDGEIARLKEEQNKVLSDQKELHKELKEKKKKAAALEEEVAAMKKEQQDGNDAIDAAKGEIIDFMNLGGTVKEKVARYDTMLENINLRRAELRQKYLSEKSEDERVKAETATLETQLQTINDNMADNQQRLNRVESELRTKTDRSGTVRADMTRYNQELIRLKSRHEGLRNLSERYEGYGNSIRKVMEQKGRNAGIIGVVADIIETEPAYETAIETALGGSIQNIVTEDEKTAKEMIAFLREGKLGRATFLPISSVTPRGSVDPSALKEEGVIGIASKLVKTDPKYEKLIESLLGRNIVVENIDAAIRIARKYKQTLRLVTPGGELISPGGSMTGGAFRNNSNLLGRKRELDELTKQIADMTKAYSEAKKEDAELSMQRESLKEQRNQYQSVIQKLNLELNSVTLNLQQTRTRLAELERSFTGMKKENDELDRQVQDIDQNKSELFDTEKQQQLEIRERERIISELEKKVEETRTRRRAKEELLAEAQLMLGTVTERDSFYQNSIDRLEEDICRQEGEKKELEERSGERLKEVEELNSSISEKKNLITECRENIEKATKALEEKKEKKESINQKNKTFFTRREELSQNISGLDKSAFTLRSAIEKLEESKESLFTYMWEEYELTYTETEKLREDTDQSITEMRKEISAVKQQIKALGEVNVGAIEEFKEVSERYQFLKAQHDDIVKAEENLRSVIAELDKAMKETFAEKFQEIRAMFTKVFRELFGGGKADLTLVDEEDLLETGIVINAQPPGKKLQNMMQLSGGEKSLTAIALLFAIQSLKPSPFCLLDEIEAALDDSNVGRFAKYLKKLTKDTQFIVITHRKGTMECADILYGITMQEKGVSTLVSVNLIEDKLDD